MFQKKLKSILYGLTLSVFAIVSIIAPAAYAEGTASIAVSPPKQRVSLNPGDTYTGSFTVYNKGDEEYKYKVEVTPYSVETQDYVSNFTNENTYNQIAKWITVDSSTTGSLKPEESTEINYTVKVPTDAPGGAQYATIATTALDNSDGFMRTNTRVAMVFYAHIAGETREEGSILENNLPGIVFGGNKITASSLVENTGNTFSDAKYIMRVYPFGSSEEVYTNEDDPHTRIILPETKCYNSLSWDETPQLGLFTVEQTIEFMGQTSTTSKLVLVCPVWLIVIFVALILAIIFTIVTRARSRKQSRRESSASRSHEEKSDKKSEDD
ncbi:hypothetical protein IJI55_02685 [Candidatus Saccharibacteria bacterium]|nr:hypothetical protein [Candidatus Saccharibacteria bacterium]